ncbi:hypothetical protein FACS1894145_5810 [Bacteroidia bacterium]|nr:hypothetical protein FACS1894145_5810 [Bacteroidia bacterium]
MNESYKKKSEGELIENIFHDDRSRSQKLLEKCKQREKSNRLIPVRLGPKTIYLVPTGTDIENWSKNKARNLDKFRKNYQ